MNHEHIIIFNLESHLAQHNIARLISWVHGHVIDLRIKPLDVGETQCFILELKLWQLNMSHRLSNVTSHSCNHHIDT